MTFDGKLVDLAMFFFLSIKNHHISTAAAWNRWIPSTMVSLTFIWPGVVWLKIQPLSAGGVSYELAPWGMFCHRWIRRPERRWKWEQPLLWNVQHRHGIPGVMQPFTTAWYQVSSLLACGIPVNSPWIQSPSSPRSFWLRLDSVMLLARNTATRNQIAKSGLQWKDWDVKMKMMDRKWMKMKESWGFAYWLCMTPSDFQRLPIWPLTAVGPMVQPLSVSRIATQSVGVSRRSEKESRGRR